MLITNARLSFLDTCDDLSWRFQEVQQYTHEVHHPDRIELRAPQKTASQKNASPITGSLDSIKVQSISKFVSVNREVSKTLEGVL